MYHVIVGAGIAGLTVGFELARAGKKVLIVEKNPYIGGLACSFRYEDFIFDVGPHRFHSHDPITSQYIKSRLKDEIVVIGRNSGVRMFNRFYSWPLHPSVILNLPVSIIVKIGIDLFTSIYRKRQIRNFEDYIINMYGPTLYNVFFKDYTEKFLLIPPDRTHIDWAKTGIDRAIIDKRVKMNTLKELIVSTFFTRKKPTEFIYPSKGGIGYFSQLLAGDIRLNKGKIITAATVEDITVRDGKIRSVTVQGKKYPVSTLTWTGPMPEIAGMLTGESSCLKYLSLLLYNVEIEGKAALDFQWCYFGTKDVIFNRISNPAVFHSGNVPAGKSSLCVEVTCMKDDEKWQDPRKLTDLVIDGLYSTGIVRSPRQVKQVHIEKIENSYPIYHVKYKQLVEDIRLRLGKFSNLYLAGRTACFWYNNMDQSIEQALGIAERIFRATSD